MKVSILTKFTAFHHGSAAPRIHPIIQLMMQEWQSAYLNKWQPNLGIFTNARLKDACDEVTNANPDWHKDLRVTDLESYISKLSANKKWWVLPGSRLSAAHGSDNGAP